MWKKILGRVLFISAIMALAYLILIAIFYVIDFTTMLKLAGIGVLAAGYLVGRLSGKARGF